MKLRSYADRLGRNSQSGEPRGAGSTPAQDGFRYRFETSPGDALAPHWPRLPLTTPEFERQAPTPPLPSPEVTAKVPDTVVEMSNDELVAAVRAEAVRRASSTEEALRRKGQRRRRAASRRFARSRPRGLSRRYVLRSGR